MADQDPSNLQFPTGHNLSQASPMDEEGSPPVQRGCNEEQTDNANDAGEEALDAAAMEDVR